MRETKFRGLTIAGEWQYGNLAITKTDFNGTEAGSYISNSAGRPFAYHVRPETVGQFIHRYDIYDVEIYEGDIVEYEDTGMCDSIINADTYRRGKVVFEDCQFCFVGENNQWADPTGNEIHKIKIIGNIYQSIELLREKK